MHASENSLHQVGRSVGKRKACPNQINLVGFRACANSWTLALIILSNLWVTKKIPPNMSRTAMLLNHFPGPISIPQCKRELSGVIPMPQIDHIGKFPSSLLHIYDVTIWFVPFEAHYLHILSQIIYCLCKYQCQYLHMRVELFPIISIIEMKKNRDRGHTCLWWTWAKNHQNHTVSFFCSHTTSGKVK